MMFRLLHAKFCFFSIFNYLLSEDVLLYFHLCTFFLVFEKSILFFSLFLFFHFVFLDFHLHLESTISTLFVFHKLLYKALRNTQKTFKLFTRKSTSDFTFRFSIYGPNWRDCLKRLHTLVKELHSILKSCFCLLILLNFRLQYILINLCSFFLLNLSSFFHSIYVGFSVLLIFYHYITFL